MFGDDNELTKNTMYKDSWIKANVFISLMNWKTEGIKETEEKKHELKISKTIEELWKEMHKLTLDCVFIKIKIEKKGKKKPFCSNQPISIKSGENWQTF